MYCLLHRFQNATKEIQTGEAYDKSQIDRQCSNFKVEESLFFFLTATICWTPITVTIFFFKKLHDWGGLTFVTLLFIPWQV